MDFFLQREGELFAEDIPIADLAARYGTPLYIYSRATLERHWRVFDAALAGHAHRICYAVKANSNIAVLQVLAKLGSGFDIVSQGELERVLAAGGSPAKIIFSGVGKLASEIERALEVGISCFNVESAAELERIQSIAVKLGKIAPVAIRVNPNIDARTHPYISTGLKENKFGVDSAEVIALYQKINSSSHLRAVGIACHIGSQLTDLTPFLEAFARIYELYTQLQNCEIQLSHIDLGGGLGVCYLAETPPSPEEYAAALLKHLGSDPVELIFEPGRAIAANAGILVTQVEYLKHTGHKNFAVVDAAMNDFLRPALYQAEQTILPVKTRTDVPVGVYDVVGPVCETADFLGKGRQLAIAAGDLLAIRTAGAYGFTMASNYNSRRRPAEVLVDKKEAYLIRRREEWHELFSQEALLG